MASIADYPGALARILDADVPDDATTKDEIESALRSSSAPQITASNASDAAEAVTTVEDVVAAVENSGEVPTASEIDSIAQALDQYGLDRTDAVVDDVQDSIAVREDIEEAVRDEDPTFKDEVEKAVKSVDGDIVGGSEESVAQQMAQQAGAPDRQSVVNEVANSERASARSFDADGVEGTGQVQVIRDSDGDAVSVVGSGASEADAQAVASSLGARYEGSGEEGLRNVVDNVEPEGRGGSARLKLRGRVIGEAEI